MARRFVLGTLGILLVGIAVNTGCGGGSSSPPPPVRTLTSIVVGPATPSIANGTTLQFTATGHYNDGSSQDLTASATWSSSQTGVATISNAGLATAKSVGASVISATSGSVSGSTTLTVTELVSIAVKPANPSVVAGGTQQFTATGTFSDSSTQDLTTSVTWSSAKTNFATISNTAGTQGLATGVAAGSSQITATSGSVNGSTTLTVTAATLQSIVVTPANPSIVAGSTQQFTATGHYSDSSTQDLTTSVTWSSAKTNFATISNTAGTQGLATAVAAGSSQITATSGTVQGSTTLTVTAATLQSIVLTPANPSIAAGTTQQFTATGHYSDSSTQDLTTSVTWSSAKTNFATISNTAGTQGLATGVAAGSSQITATSGSVNGSTTLTVTAATLQSISVTPASPSIPEGTTQQFTATGHYSDSSTQDLTTSATWSSTDTTVAMISNTAGSQGLATAIKAGTTTIGAAFSSKSGTASLSVTTPVNASAWNQDGPLARFSQSGVFDDTTKQMIVFAGQDTATGANLDDLWLISTGVDKHVRATSMTSTTTGPSARFGHSAIYDSNNNVMTIFGGGSSTSSCSNDVWVLDGANGATGSPSWNPVSASGTPPSARMRHDAAYDSASNTMIVFGGSDCGGGYLNDVWVLSNANGQGGTPTWTKLSPTGTAPSAREGSSAIYDSVNNILVIYGGDAGGGPFGDVWTLTNANGQSGTPAWGPLSPTGTAPAARSGHSALYDSGTNRMIVFGGVDQSTSTTFGDTWYLSDPSGTGATPTWNKITASGTAPTVYFHNAAYDSTANAMYLFGGTSSGSKLLVSNHTFVLSKANGSAASAWTVSGPPVRYSQSAFYDAATNGLFAFGGQHATTNINFNDYWRNSGVVGTTGVNWVNLAPTGTKPTPRFGHAAAYDSATTTMMMFGGATGFPAPCVNEYWVLNNANTATVTPSWLQLTPSGTPPLARMRHSIAYDSATNTLIVFGGYDCTSTYFNDVWVLSNANDASGTPAWTQLSPTGTPPSGREGASTVYDSTSNSLIVFGGDSDFTNGSNPLGDVWVLSHANGTGGTPAWTEITPAGIGPAARSGHTAIYDTTNNRMTVYGGFDGTNVLSDAWILSDADGSGVAVWVPLNPSPAGPPRRFHSSVYDPVSNEMLVFGGVSVMNPLAPDANTFSLTDANGLP